MTNVAIGNDENHLTLGDREIKITFGGVPAGAPPNVILSMDRPTADP